ncbi:hypothetical protein ACFL1K_05325 [Candidatus Omnitrophota bacterium]
MIAKDAKTITRIFAIACALIFFCHAQSFTEEQGAGRRLRESVGYSAQELRDPFDEYKSVESASKGPEEKEREVSPPSLTVQGVIWGAGFPQAIINEKVVKVGDSVDGVRIVDIEKDMVHFLYYDTLYALSSPAQAVRKGEEECPECKKRRQGR